MAHDPEETPPERSARRAHEPAGRDGRSAPRAPDRRLSDANAQENRRDATDAVGVEEDSAAPPVTNLDRALSPAARRRARDSRQAESPVASAAPTTEPPPEEHFMVLADRAALHILAEEHPPGQRTAILRALYHEVFPLGRESYFARDTGPQGRFPHNRRQGGQSIDERLPMQQEQERRLIRQIGRALATFLRHRPDATWDFAAAAPLQNALLDQLEPALLDRLRRVVPKELTHQPVESLAGHFASVPTPSDDPRANRRSARPAP